MEIIYVDFGIGMRIGNNVYINRKLKKYPGLHNAVMKHEMKHSDSWSRKDFLLDLGNSDLSKHTREYFKFLFTTPKAWINFLPIIRINRKICVDITLLIFYLIVGGVVGCLYYVI